MHTHNRQIGMFIETGGFLIILGEVHSPTFSPFVLCQIFIINSLNPFWGANRESVTGISRLLLSGTWAETKHRLIVITDRETERETALNKAPRDHIYRMTLPQSYILSTDTLGHVDTHTHSICIHYTISCCDEAKYRLYWDSKVLGCSGM